MPKLKCGHEICDTCGKRYIAILAGDCCQCEIDAAHLTSTEALTGVALKYRQRARVAEELNKIMYEALKKIEDCPNVCNCCKYEAVKATLKGELK